MTSHFWQVLTKSEGMLFNTIITEIRGTLHEAMVSIAKSQGAASCFSKLLVHLISTYSYNQGYNPQVKSEKDIY